MSKKRTGGHPTPPGDGDGALECADCGTVFVLGPEQRAFFVERGLAMPRRCRPCRQKRRAAEARYPIVCGECGAKAIVAFKPVDGRPVFCPTCHRARKGSIQQATEGLGDEDDAGIIE